jgi:hypothetical protein
VNAWLSDNDLRIWLKRMPARYSIISILELHGGRCKTSALLEYLECALKTLDNVLAILIREDKITVSQMWVSLVEDLESTPATRPDEDPNPSPSTAPRLDPKPVPTIDPNVSLNHDPTLSPSIDPTLAPKSGSAVPDNQNTLGGDYRGGEVLLGSLNKQIQQSQSVETVSGGGSGGSEKTEPPKTRVSKPAKTPKPPKPKAGTAAAAWIEYLEEHKTAPDWLDLDAWGIWLKDLDQRVPFKGSTVGRLVNHLQKLEKIHADGQSQALAVSAACGGGWKAPYLPRDAVEANPNPNSTSTAFQTPKPVPKHSFKEVNRADVQLERLRAEIAARSNPDQIIKTVPARTVPALPNNPQPGGKDNDPTDPDLRHN